MGIWIIVEPERSIGFNTNICLQLNVQNWSLAPQCDPLPRDGEALQHPRASEVKCQLKFHVHDTYHQITLPLTQYWQR